MDGNIKASTAGHFVPGIKLYLLQFTILIIPERRKPFGEEQTPPPFLVEHQFASKL